MPYNPCRIIFACSALALFLCAAASARASVSDDGFLLPLLADASPDPARYDGRRLLLKTAAVVCGTVGQTDRQLAALMLLRWEAGSNENL